MSLGRSIDRETASKLGACWQRSDIDLGQRLDIDPPWRVEVSFSGVGVVVVFAPFSVLVVASSCLPPRGEAPGATASHVRLLVRWEGPCVVRMGPRLARRSSRAVVSFSSPSTWTHSEKARLVVIMVAGVLLDDGSGWRPGAAGR
jgi:hypothetical protein